MPFPLGVHPPVNMVSAQTRSPIAVDLMAVIKNAIDPASIMNPGEVLPD